MSQLPSWFKVQGENLDYNVTYDGQTAHVEFFLFDGARYTYTIDGEGPYSTNQVEQISFDLQDYFEGLPVGSDEEDDVMSGTHSYDYYLGDNVTYNGQTYVIIDDEDNLLTLRPKDRFGDNDFDNPELGDSSEDVFLEPWQLAQAQKVTGVSEEDDEDLPMVDQEYDSAATSINSNKLPAIYKMVSFNPGDVIVDFGGGKFDNAVEYIKDKGATLCVYDPYNRSAEHNKEVLRILRENGGADAAVNSNVLNVIKEPEARKNVLENIARITKPGAPIYITVYEGKGNGQEGPTKSGYQLNRKTADYLEEIQEVFPDATRKGKLITAHNSGSVTSSTVEGSISPEEFFTKDDLINFAIEVVDKINDRINPKHQFDVEDAYFKGSKVYVSIGNDEYSLSGDAIVDMRKIHRSEDLTKYIDTIVTQMIEEYNEQSSVDSSTNIQELLMILKTNGYLLRKRS